MVNKILPKKTKEKYTTKSWRHNFCFTFPSMQTMVNKILPKKTKEKYTTKSLKSCNSCTVSFDLWMSKAKVDTFFINKWEPCHVTMIFFETTKKSKSSIALQLIEVLAKHGFNVGVIVYVKDEGGNFSTIISTLVFVVSCEVLGLTIPFVKTYWGHVYVKVLLTCTTKIPIF